MPGVYYSDRANSTTFTTCCHVAICDDQLLCPVCKQEIEPTTLRGRHEMAMQKMYGREELKRRYHARTKNKK